MTSDSTLRPPVLPKRVHIKTYGCQMNVYDSERMSEALAPLGYTSTDLAAEADLVLINTCHIREKASEKLYSDLGRLRDMKAERADGDQVMIAVAGCVAQAEGDEIIRRAPDVDLVIGPQAYHRLPELISRRTKGEKAAFAPQFEPESKFQTLSTSRDAHGVSAFLTVQEGCDKFCAFCVVPYTRGAEYSRPAAQILEEARALASKGVRELTLLGQNVNAYGGDDGAGAILDLASLVRRLTQIPGLARLRYTTSHPNDMAESLIEAHADIDELMPYLHLPVQSGSDRILAAMNRKHTAEDYLKIVERLRRARPDLALSGDFIVGFPGETEADFEATLSLVREVGYASAFSFKYSRRPGTPAASSTVQIDEDIKTERLARLNALLEDQRQTFNRSKIGDTFPVLFEKPGRHEGQLIGRSPWLQAVWAEAPLRLVGELANVRITGVGPNSLTGTVVTVEGGAL
jgi:tRNA-2-methylthio-N6-dimethylallyladenosine synthase